MFVFKRGKGHIHAVIRFHSLWKCQSFKCRKWSENQKERNWTKNKMKTLLVRMECKIFKHPLCAIVLVWVHKHWHLSHRLSFFIPCKIKNRFSFYFVSIHSDKSSRKIKKKKKTAKKYTKYFSFWIVFSTFVLRRAKRKKKKISATIKWMRKIELAKIGERRRMMKKYKKWFVIYLNYVAICKCWTINTELRRIKEK